MKAVILAGGRGTRLGEISSIKPKPMVQIGNKPILWHIMKLYSSYNIKDFIICAGYLGHEIKDYFSKFLLNNSDVEIDLSNKSINYLSNSDNEDWKIKIIDTGLETLTGGRLIKIKNYLNDDEPFFLTYGDGLANINMYNLLKFHNSNNKLVTMSAVFPPPRFGSLEIKDQIVTEFSEKNLGDIGRINGGFFVCEKKSLDFIKSDQPWESEPLRKLSKENELMAYLHDGFWQPMDTMRERDYLETLWKTNKAPWRVWS